MNDLDTAIRAALTADADRAPNVDLQWAGPLTTIGPPPQLPTRWPRVAVLAVAAVVLIAGVWVVARRSSDAPVQPIGGAAPSAARPLLFPPNSAPVGGPVDESPGRYAALLSAPSGALFTIDLGENFWGPFPADVPTRTVNGNVFGAVASNSYVMLEPCSMTGTRGPPSQAKTWNEQALALLSTERGDRGVVTVSLPAGWAVFEAPAQLVTGYLYSVEHGVSGEATSFWVAPATGMSAIYGIYGPPQTTQRADFDSHRAWFSIYPSSTGPANDHLTWEAAGNAYDITARGATVEQLVAFARTLVPASISDLVTSTERAGVSQPPQTIATTTPVAPGACITRALKVEQAP